MIHRVPLVGVCAFVMVSLGGCVENTGTNGSSGQGAQSSASTASITRGKTAEERALEREVRDLNQVTRDIIVRNTVQGAIVGAIAGCGIAEATDRNCGRGALVGGLIGGVAGNQIGQQAAAANRELVQLDQTIARLQAVQQRLSGVETNLRAVLSRQNSEIASLRRQVAAGQVSAGAAESRISSINDNRRTVINGLAASENNIAQERATLVSLEQESGQNLNSARTAVSSTESRIRSLRNTVNLVAS